MQWHKNKILVASAIYVVSIVVIAFMFGLWHNSHTSIEVGKSLMFVFLLILVLAFFSWYYFTIFKIDRKEKEQLEEKAKAVEVDLEEKDVEVIAEEKTAETFDTEVFINDIIAGEKKVTAEYCETILKNLADKLNIVIGLFYVRNMGGDTFESIARYAFYSDHTPPGFSIGESLSGQAVKDKKVLVISNVPENYLPVVSGLGSSKPKNIVMIPVVAGGEPIGLVEIAMFKPMEQAMEPVLKELGNAIGKNLIKLLK